ncbi:type I restriction-modification DNA methylase [Bodo saltans virus]|uniref:site-specific DNA-methyltransferase (adenine-specific) n=1 Tax=Bodo saltans virus TaxID=2024608 RepID=A0A2H4UVI2_9VIRU|nr:type I restriction-modification DNA methylase [Bodo saltans virus]ATZ80866.1 type I restriction-modification DNA methylase [Bodo saltans virus]
MAHECKLCKKVFKLKTDYDRHVERKTPCVSKDKIIEDCIASSTFIKKNNESIDKIKKFLDFCHDTLRDNEGIIGMDALENISMLIFLKFINDRVRLNQIDLLNIEKYRVDANTCDDKFKKNIKYVKYCQFNNIIEDGKFKVEICEISNIIEFIFKHVLWHHPYTKNIFQDELPSIKTEVTYEQILKRLDKLEWESMDVDIKGVAYEHFLKYEIGSGDDLGQFLTRREVIDYIIASVKPYFKKDSTFIDPFMGTGAFITRAYCEMKKIYANDKTPFTHDIKTKLFSGIEKNQKTCMLALNNCLVSMDMYPINIKCGDSLRNYIKDKYDFVLTNPPYGIKGLSYDNESMFPKEYMGVKKNDYIPIQTKDAVCLAIQASQYYLKNGGYCVMVVPDGKQFNGKEKAMIEMRKKLVEKSNLYQITKLKTGTFLPYTGVETMILFFKNGEKTRNIKFVKLEDDYKTEKIIITVDIEQIKKENYSFNYKLYFDEKNDKHCSVSNKKFGDLFDLILGKTQSSSVINIENGKGKFINKGDYESWQIIDEKQCDTFGNNLFFGTKFNGNGKMPIRFYSGACTYSNLISLVKPKNDNIINIKFYYYYFTTIKSIIEINYAKGAANKSLDIDAFNKYLIPYPSLGIQDKIVNELDLLNDNIITCKKQIDDFRKILKIYIHTVTININEKKSCDDIFNMIIGKNTSDAISDDGIYEFYNGSANSPIGKAKNYSCDNDTPYLLMIKDGGSGEKNYSDKVGLAKIFYVSNKTSFTTSVVALINKYDKNIETKYLYYYLQYSKNYLMDLAKYTTGLGHIGLTNIKNYFIKIPQLEKQKEIIKYCDEIEYIIQAMEQRVKYNEDLMKTIMDNCLIDTKKDNLIFDSIPVSKPISKSIADLYSSDDEDTKFA